MFPAFLAILAMASAAAAQDNLITCKRLSAVDGDTARCDGQLLRDMGDGAPDVSGYDTPEIRGYKCPEEKALGMKAKRRMAELLKTEGLRIVDLGETTTGRGDSIRLLVWIKLPDGRSIGCQCSLRRACPALDARLKKPCGAAKAFPSAAPTGQTGGHLI